MHRCYSHCSKKFGHGDDHLSCDQAWYYGPGIYYGTTMLVSKLSHTIYFDISIVCEAGASLDRWKC